MAYVPGCSYDLFISYATENNRDGWVEQFEKALGEELGELIGRQFSAKESIFFDKRELEVTQSFPDKLDAAARDSAILVPILSPSYLMSPWCNRERVQFFSRLPDGAQASECLAPIAVRPIDPGGLDALYRNAQQISFLSQDGQTPLAAGSPEWIAQLRGLAGQLKNALQRLRRNCKPVFLGKATRTDRCQSLRAWLRTELERRYSRTAPESLLALDDLDAVRASMQEASLAIHFLGGSDEATLEAIDASVAACIGPTILYQPFGVDLKPDEQLWLDDFERELKPEIGYYQRLVGKNDQELLALIDEQITLVRTKPINEVAPVELALVCEESDLEGVRQLKNEIKTRRSVEVKFPDFLGGRLKAMERLRMRHDFLRRAQALLFYYGTAERNRLELFWQEAQQRRPDARRDWFLAPPNLESKRQQHPDA